MESLYLLIPLGFVLILGAAIILIWAVRSGQYEDLEREASRILFEDAGTRGQENTQTGSRQETRDD